MKTFLPWLSAILLLGTAHAAQPEVVIGDSLACGVQEAGHLPGVCRVGASPAEVYRMTTAYPAVWLRGRTVFLSGGVSNDPDQIGYVAAQKRTLEAAGATVIMIGVGQGIPGAERLNAELGAAASGWPGVHPHNYGTVLQELRAHEQH